MRGRRECQQRRLAQTVEIHVAIYVREEVDGYTRAHPRLIAKEHRVLESGQAPAVNGEDDFVDRVLPQDAGQIPDRADGVIASQLYAPVLRRILIQEAEQPDTVLPRFFQRSG